MVPGIGVGARSKTHWEQLCAYDFQTATLYLIIPQMIPSDPIKDRCAAALGTGVSPEWLGSGQVDSAR